MRPVHPIGVARLFELTYFVLVITATAQTETVKSKFCRLRRNVERFIAMIYTNLYQDGRPQIKRQPDEKHTDRRDLGVGSGSRLGLVLDVWHPVNSYRKSAMCRLESSLKFRGGGDVSECHVRTTPPSRSDRADCDDQSTTTELSAGT
jgi:hypothetical protein